MTILFVNNDTRALGMQEDFTPAGQGQFSLWCWRGSLACPRPKTGYWGRINILVFVCCIVLYSTLFEEQNIWGVPHLLPVFVVLFWIDLISVQNSVVVCVCLCVCVCVFVCCVSFLRAKFGFSARLSCFECITSFWPEYRKFAEEVMDSCSEFRKKKSIISRNVLQQSRTTVLLLN